MHAQVISGFLSPRSKTPKKKKLVTQKPSPHTRTKGYDIIGGRPPFSSFLVRFFFGKHGVPIASDARVRLPVAAVIAGILAHQHIAVLADAVAFVLRDVVPAFRRLGFGGRPGQVIPPHLDVIVGELAQLVVVHAEQFGFLGGAQVEAGDVVDGEGDESGHDEGVADAGDDVGDLDVELLVVVVGPAADDDAGVDAVEADDVGCSEKGIGDEAEDTGDTVLGKDVHGVINAKPVLDWKRLCQQWIIEASRSIDLPLVA